MPRTVDQINADILAVRTEISSPAQEVRYADRTVRNRTTDEAARALAILESELATAQALVLNMGRVRQIRLFTNGGFTNGLGNA